MRKSTSKRKVLSAFEIQQQRPVELRIEQLDPADKSLPLPPHAIREKPKIVNRREVAKWAETHDFGGLVPDREGTQHWQCTGCDKIYEDRPSAWSCCRLGPKRVNVCKICRQTHADCTCSPTPPIYPNG
jgi:hypothetical protein